MATGDIPNYYYVLRLPAEFASWFCLPDVRAGAFRQLLEGSGLGELGRALERGVVVHVDEVAQPRRRDVRRGGGGERDQGRFHVGSDRTQAFWGWQARF